MFFSNIEVVIDIVAILSACITVLVAISTYINSRKRARFEVFSELFASYQFYNSYVNSVAAEMEKLAELLRTTEEKNRSFIFAMAKTHIIESRVLDDLDAFEQKVLAVCVAKKEMIGSLLTAFSILRIWLQNVNALYGILADGHSDFFLNSYKRCIQIDVNNVKTMYSFSHNGFYQYMKTELHRHGKLKNPSV